ncbi:hypothetical protein C2845_PMPSC039922 [Panicum miliaceum]|uniref:Uncharacterized protein n=1 Tax=Panicum miliaceum TaxID=4540 RepID=A0A3L6PDA7_PANMI|nr:hypothetical protein C2845_PMPSC039922 [Panicum miliaceum]
MTGFRGILEPQALDMGAAQEDDTFPSALRPPHMTGLCLMQLCSNSDRMKLP